MISKANKMKISANAAGLFLISSLLSITAVLSGCASSSNIRSIAPEYKSQRLSEVSVLVMPLNNEFINEEQLKEYAQDHQAGMHLYTEREHSFFERFMASAIARMTRVRIIKSHKDYHPDDIALSYHEISCDTKSSMKMCAPDTCTITYQNTTPDFVIFFEDFFVNKGYREEATMTGVDAKQNFTVNTGIKYLIWDNNKNKIASYGKISKRLVLLYIPQEETYRRIFNDFALHIIMNSPFEERFDN